MRDRFRRIYQRPVVMDCGGIWARALRHPTTRWSRCYSNLNFQIHRREFICVLGPSGCGKSTLIRILAGLEEPTSGGAVETGRPTRSSGPGPDRGMVFQSYTLFPWLTVKQNVMFGLRTEGDAPAARQNRGGTQELGRTGGVGAAFIDSYPYQLSGGMKQRVAIARALANQPRVLLMDEPFGALDAQTRAQMQAYLQQIWMNVDVTIVFITHDLDEAVFMADRIILLSSHSRPHCRDRRGSELAALNAGRACWTRVSSPPG